MDLDQDALCRAVVSAHLELDGAGASLRNLLEGPELPWYRALAVLHRQGLRAALAGLVGTVVDASRIPINVRLELARESALAEARDVVAWDRVRRVERVLSGAGLAGRVRVAPEGDIVRVSVPAGRVEEVTACLAPLDPAGPRPRDGRVNRLEPPALEIHAEAAPPPPQRWRQVLQRAEASGAELDAAALASIPPLRESQPEVPRIPPPPPLRRPRHVLEILAVRLGGVGDVLFALPALAAVKGAYPGARLVLLADTAQREHLLRRSGSIDAVEPFDWDLRDPDSGRRGLARERFAARARAADLLVVFGPLLALAGIDHGTPTLELRVERGAGHTAQQWLAGAHAAGFGSDPVALALPTPPVHVTDEERATARERLCVHEHERCPAPHIALSLGATTVYKMWPVESFAALARALDAATGGTLWVFPHGVEVDLAGQLAELAPVRQILAVSLAELAPLLAACDLVVGNDTGPVHLAAATGSPTLALYGFTDPDFTGPLGPRTATLGGTPSSVPGSEETIREIASADALEKVRQSFPELF